MERDYVIERVHHRGRPFTAYSVSDSLSQIDGRGFSSSVLNVERLLDESFKRYLQNKTKEKERLRNAKLKVEKQEEIMRETLRSKFRDSQKKREEIMRNLSQKKSLKVIKPGIFI